MKIRTRKGNTLVYLLILSISCFFSIIAYISYRTLQTPHTVNPSEFIQEANAFLDFASKTNLDGAGFFCQTSRGQCTVSEPTSSGSVAWQLLARSAIYRTDPTDANKEKIESQYRRMSTLSYTVPFVHGSSFYQAYKATNDMRYATYAYVHTSKQASELASRPTVPNYGSMLLGMVGQELSDIAQLTTDPDFKSFYIKTVLASRKQSQREELNEKSLEQQLQDARHLFFTQAIRVRDLLASIMQNTAENETRTEHTLPVKKIDRYGNDIADEAHAYKALNPEWAFARCWLATVNASLFQATGNDVYRHDAVKNLETLETTQGTLKLLTSDAVAPSAYIPCIEAAILIRQKSTDRGPWLDSLIQRLTQSSIMNAFDSQYRPRCSGDGGVLVSWPAEQSSNISEDLCSTTPLTIADTSHAIFVVSQIQGLFNL
jgi:hypothetical protein